MELCDLDSQESAMCMLPTIALFLCGFAPGQDMSHMSHKELKNCRLALAFESFT